MDSVFERATEPAGGQPPHPTLRLDATTRTVACGLRELTLSDTDFRLLRHFLNHAGQLVTRDAIRQALWGSDVMIDERTIDARVSRLRKALRRIGEPEAIQTLRKLGYRLRS